MFPVIPNRNNRHLRLKLVTSLNGVESDHKILLFPKGITDI